MTSCGFAGDQLLLVKPAELRRHVRNRLFDNASNVASCAHCPLDQREIDPVSLRAGPSAEQVSSVFLVFGFPLPLVRAASCELHPLDWDCHLGCFVFHMLCRRNVGHHII